MRLWKAGSYIHSRVAVLIAGAALFVPSGSFGASIVFTAINLVDTTPGEDRWQYQYTVSGFNFSAGQGFTIIFDRSLYTLLQNPPPAVNGDWDAITLQPDLALNSDGLYDAQAKRDAPSFADAFLLGFVWRGTGEPGSQTYSIYNPDFSTVLLGQTIPEISTPISIISGAVMLVRRRRL